MNILFELNHPAHAHLFKNTIRYLIKNGHNIKVIIKEVKILKVILDDAGIEHISFGNKSSNLLIKGINQFYYIFKAWKLHQKMKFDLGIGVSVTLPLLSRITSMESVVLDDDDKKATPLFAFLSHKNANILLRPAALKHEGENKNTIYYQGYHELAYLHPDVFSPDSSVLSEQGLNENELFFIIRLVSLKAHHDIGKKGINKLQLSSMINILLPFGKVVFTHETEGIDETGTLPLRVHPSRLHHLMSFAKLIISDGQTMCSEAACLGVPSVRINDFAGRISYLEEIEKRWQLSYGFRPDNFDSAIEKIKELLKSDKETFRKRRDIMISSSLNPTNLLINVIENYPESLKNIKELTNKA